MNWEFKVTGRYLWVPVEKGAEKVILEIFSAAGVNGEKEKRKIFEGKVPFAQKQVDFYGVVDLEGFRGEKLFFTVNGEDDFVRLCQLSESLPGNQPEQHPKLHYTAPWGWINDPNGLVCHDGKYHLYHQWNPFDIAWENMTWGHSVSRDLIHWENFSVAMQPDESGTMFSGCAVEDSKNLLGFGGGALLFYYTASGNCSKWSEGKPAVQKLAYSTDGGATLHKLPGNSVDYIAEGNRDPKIIYYPPKQSYHMVLYLSGNDFAIFRSHDLKKWEMTQKLTLEKAWECPDLFELPVDGTEERKKWVFWSADGYYFVGRFDGEKFIPETERLCAYEDGLPYAAQTFWGIPGRVVSVSWLRIPNYGKNYTGAMAIPAEVSLVSTKEGPRISLAPVRELEQCRKEESVFLQTDRKLTVAEVEENAFELRLRLDGKVRGSLVCLLPEGELFLDFEKGRGKFREKEFPVDVGRDAMARLIYDYDAAELFIIRKEGPALYLPCENPVKKLAGSVSVSPQNGCVIPEIIYDLLI